MREGRHRIRSRTLVGARRCLAAIEDSVAPRATNAAALATVMAQMARTDIGLSALLGNLDGWSGNDGDMLVRCDRGRMTRIQERRV